MKSKSSSSRHGLLAGGNWIIDQVKLIDVYPQREQLANIRRQCQGTGGAPYNVLVGLARLGCGFPLFGAGLIGKDALGELIFEECRKLKIDARALRPGQIGGAIRAAAVDDQHIVGPRHRRQTRLDIRGLVQRDDRD